MRISTMKSNKPLIKRELGNGKMDSFPMVYKSLIQNHEFDTIDSFIEIYEQVQSENGALLQGMPFEDGYQRRLTIPDKETGDEATLDTQTKMNLFVVDLDKIPCINRVGSDEHLFEVYSLLGRLDPVFEAADSIFAYSSSAGVKTENNPDPWYVMNSHVYYLIEDSTQQELRGVFSYLNQRARDLGLVPEGEKLLDASIIKLTQPIYVSRPELIYELDLTRGVIRRSKERLLDIGPWKEQVVIPEIERPQEEDQYEVTLEEISDFNKDVAKSLIYGNANGESYSGLLSVITYLKQRKHSKEQVWELWQEIYAGDNWTLEEQKLFDQKWFDIKYIEPDYFTNLKGKNDEVYISTGYNNGCRCLVPDWDISTLKLLATKVHKPVVLMLSLELEEATVNNIYRRAVHAGFKSIRVERYKGRNKTRVVHRSIQEIIGVAPGGEYDNFVL